jgi:dolichyl-phosphate beta-glucosyltransferase
MTTTTDTIDLSIIIPAHKEAGRIPEKLAELADWLDSHDYGTIEILVVANCTEGTADAARTQANRFKHFRVIDEKTRLGKGGAVRLGMFEARGRYRLFMDADLATPLSHLDDVHRFMQQGSKVAIAVRDLVKIHKGLVRKIITKTANVVVQVLVLPGIKDSQCGFKLFEGHAAEQIFSRQTLTSWSFDVEVLAIARYLGYKIDTFTANDWKEPKPESGGLTGDSPLKVAIQQAKDPLIVRLNLWRGVYKQPKFEHKTSGQTS